MTADTKAGVAPPFLDRPLFTGEEASNILGSTDVTPCSGETLISPAHILCAVATALHEALFEVAGGLESIEVNSML